MIYVEALGHIERAQRLILTLPAGIERDEWELGLLSIEGTSRMALDGWDTHAMRGGEGPSRRAHLRRPTLAGFAVQARLLQFYGPDPWREDKDRLDYDKLLIRELVEALIDHEATTA